MGKMKEKELKIVPELVDSANDLRQILMKRGYFVRGLYLVDENTVDVVAIRETITNSERWRIRLIIPPAYGGLTTTQVRTFFHDQSKIHDLDGFIISLGSISNQAKQLIEKRGFPVFSKSWFTEN